MNTQDIIRFFGTVEQFAKQLQIVIEGCETFIECLELLEKQLT